MDEIKIGDKLNWFRWKLNDNNDYIQVKYTFTITDKLLLEFANKNLKKFFKFLDKTIDGWNNSTIKQNWLTNDFY